MTTTATLPTTLTSTQAADYLQLIESHHYSELFLNRLYWGAPDNKPVDVTVDDDRTFTATNVATFQGLRVWQVSARPGSQVEAQIDRAVGETTTDRLIIFYDDNEQVWRWPVKRMTGSSTTARLTSHRHRTGTPADRLLHRVATIALPLEHDVTINEVLTKLRTAFDVETQNETKQASRLMARMYTAMDSAFDPSIIRAARDHQISVTLARILFLMFGDDTAMWKADLFRTFIHSYTATDSSDLGSKLTRLFDHLNTPPAHVTTQPGDGISEFPYVNGGIFTESLTLPEVGKDFRDTVLEACAVDWATISPAIFGSMFQSVRDAETRRQLGEHYTAEENILKTLNPLFLDELRAEFDRICRLKTKQTTELRKLWQRLGDIRFLDPACGCGNFIIVAYRELRSIELTVMEQLQKVAGTEDQQALVANAGLKVTLDHFHGIEIDEWPAKIAETAMFLIDRQCDLRLNEKLGWTPNRLPIQQQANVVVGNALTLDWQAVVRPTPNVFVAGNPPYLGKSQRSADQTAWMRTLWGEDYTGETDYVTTWMKAAADYFGTRGGKWALVMTNSVCQGGGVASTFGPLYRMGWRINFAHQAFSWKSEATGAAGVHCVIVGMTNQSGPGSRLFASHPNGRGTHEVAVEQSVNAYLLDAVNVLIPPRQTPISVDLASDIAFGSMPADGGFLLLKPTEAAEVLASDPYAQNYLRRFVGAKELLHGLERWCIWLPQGGPEDEARSDELAERASLVRAFREEGKDGQVRSNARYPLRFNRNQQPDGTYLCIPAHVGESRTYYLAKRFSKDVVCSNANFRLSDPTGFMFAMLTSGMFMAWQKAIGGRIRADLRFASTVTWNTLPLPTVDLGAREQIADLGRAVEQRRAAYPGVSLAQLYSPATIPDDLVATHQALDEAVDRAFGAAATCAGDRQRQQVLFARYAELVDQSH